MPKRFLRNALLMAVVTVLMALSLVFYIHNTNPLPGGENPNNVLLLDGVYTSVQQGYLSEVTVTVTISSGMVSDVQADASGETPALGGVAAAQLATALTEAGSSANVDVVSGSTYTSEAVLAGMDDCLAQAAG
ncbi:FMN-binding protein [Faecalibacterium sp. An192]|uniref:FMN-binding protein n=1 Tax=Faecalibacterium sp. An192 TaxID=1965581 RepID=UPI000B397D6B|nr:FMN-binding protein [Faecalibacterium sp. An192]OUP30028.1 FMN-binding protein [Faecalibacterium sp. An192]